MDWLARLMGIQGERVSRVVGADMRLGGGLGWGWVLLLAIGLIALAVWTYRNTERLTKRRRITLTTLRCVLLALLLLILLRPSVAFTVEGSIRRTLLLLVDGSASMQIQDPRHAPADIQRVNIATGVADPAKGLDQGPTGPPQSMARLDVVKNTLRNDKLRLLRRLNRDYDLRFFTFGDATAELPPADPNDPAKTDAAWIDALKADAPATAIGDALRQTLGRVRGQPLAGIVLVTDGAANAGEQPLGAAELAGVENVPLYVYGVGISEPRDIVVANVFGPEVAFFDDVLPLTVRVKARGLADQSATLKVELVRRDNGQVQQTETRDIQLSDGEQAIAMKLTPKRPDASAKQIEYDIRASVAPRDDEAAKDNNLAATRVRVIDGKIKVLYVEQSPRWEFRYLQAMLLRDKRVELKCVLLEADASVAVGENTPYLPTIPAKREDLFAFDLIILGDVDPKAIRPEHASAITEFVSKFGGGLLFLAGRMHNPAEYTATGLEALLPIEGTADLGAGANEAGYRPIQVELTPAGKAETMLQLSDKPAENDTIWAKFPPIFWTAPVARAKPAARVLLADPSPDRASRFGPMPIIAMQQYGLGQVLFCGTDNTWRWRRNENEPRHAALWRQIVQRLALPHLMGESKRTQLTSDRKTYTTGDRVGVYARLYTREFNPVTDPVVRGTYTVNGRSVPIELRPMPDQPGMYRGEFVAGEPGPYTFAVEVDPESKLEFAVTPPRLELGETAMQEKLLRQLADASGGKFLREENLDSLPDLVKAKSETVRSTHNVELWANPFYFTIIVVVAGVEWFLRKRNQLK